MKNYSDSIKKIDSKIPLINTEKLLEISPDMKNFKEEIKEVCIKKAEWKNSKRHDFPLADS